MDTKEIRHINVSIKEAKVDGDKREFEAIITTNSIDRDFEVLLPSGANLKNFKKNPVILLNHSQRDLPIGSAVSIRQTDKGNALKMKGKIAKNVNRADDAWELIKQGVLSAISIGFQIIEQRVPTKADIKEFGKNIRNVISKYELLEVSVVSVPANQEALITAVKSMDLDPKDFIPDYVEEKSVEEQVEEQIVELEIDVETIEKEKIVEAVKNTEVNVKEIMSYFSEEMKRQIRKSHGNLF